jgi:hypothetical protein
LALAAVAIASPVRAQVVVSQPRCEAIEIELQSLLDDVEVVPGDLTDPPYVYRGWSRFPAVVLRQDGPIARLRILDRTLADEDTRSDSESWPIELMPAAVARFDLRMDFGTGRFDFTGMQVQKLDLFATFTEVDVVFRAPNPIVLEAGDLTVQSGRLELRGLLHARARRAVMRLPRSKAEIEFSGRPEPGESEVHFARVPESLVLTLPPNLPMRVVGPEALRRAFRHPALAPRGPDLETPDFESAAARLVLRFDAAVPKLVLRFGADVVLPAGGPATGASPPPAAAAGPADETSPRTDRFLAALADQRLADAAAELREIRRRHPADATLPSLERLLAVSSARPEPLPESRSRRLDLGLDLYLRGEYTNALEQFRGARRDSAVASAAEAWIRRTESEIQRLALPAVAPAPVPVAGLPGSGAGLGPVLAIRSPAANPARTRAARLAVAGVAADDHAVDRVEVTLNGAPLADATGGKIQVRGAAGDSSAVRLPFAFTVPLRRGDNEIVVTAWDADAPAHWTSERLQVVGLPPLHRTSGFVAAVLGLAFAVLVWLGLSRLVKSRIAFGHRYNPYVAGLPIRNTTMLFGRERLLQNVLNTIHNNSIMLHGPRRIGKTSLQLEIKRRLEQSRDPEYRFLPVFVDLQGTHEEQLFATIMSDILEGCRRDLRGLAAPAAPGPSYTSREFSRDLQQVLRSLQGRTDKKLKMVLLLDEVDTLNDYSEQTNQKLRGVFMKTFAESLVAVMAGTHIDKKWRSEGSPWYNFFEEIEVRPLERQDAVQLIREPVQGIYHYDDAAVDCILRYSQGRPYVIQRFCVHVINHVIEQRRRRVRAEDVEAVRAQAEHPVDIAA